MLAERRATGDPGAHGPQPAAPYDPGVNPALIALFLVATLVALLPVWRLRIAGWSRGALVTAWLLYALGIFLAVRFAGPMRFLVPILVVAYVAPFIAGPERLARVLGRRTPAGPPPIKNVTPSAPPVLPDSHAPDDSREEQDEGGPRP
jgi:hypothetical protein